jgi:hypothetical protein
LEGSLLSPARVIIDLPTDCTNMIASDRDYLPNNMVSEEKDQLKMFVLFWKPEPRRLL